MHPLLENLSIFTWMNIIESDEKCLSFLQDLRLLPKKTDDAPSCPRCSSSMKPQNSPGSGGGKLNWRWVCRKRKNKEKPCYAAVFPAVGTFFENTQIPLKDILALMFGYVLKIGVKEMQEQMNCWRNYRKEKKIGSTTIHEFNSRFKEIILIGLRQRGEFSKKLEKAKVADLLRKYCKASNVEPCHRNFVFQLLMDIRSVYPCFKKNVTCENLVSPDASTSAPPTSLCSELKDKPFNKNNSNLFSSTDASVTSVSTSVGDINTDSERAKTPNRELVSTDAVTKSIFSCDHSYASSLASGSTVEKASVVSINLNTENVQASNNNAVAIENVRNSNNNAVGIGNVRASDNNTVATRNAQTLNKNATAIENVQTLNTNTVVINQPTHENSKDPTAGTVPVTDENMEVG